MANKRMNVNNLCDWLAWSVFLFRSIEGTTNKSEKRSRWNSEGRWLKKDNMKKRKRNE
jgi:hypothetical protein